jgi:hypothetical protein
LTSPFAGTVDPTVDTDLRDVRNGALPVTAADAAVAVVGVAEAFFAVVPLLELPQPAIANAAIGTAMISFQLIEFDPLVGEPGTRQGSRRRLRSGLLPPA